MTLVGVGRECLDAFVGRVGLGNAFVQNVTQVLLSRRVGRVGGCGTGHSRHDNRDEEEQGNELHDGWLGLLIVSVGFKFYVV